MLLRARGAAIALALIASLVHTASSRAALTLPDTGLFAPVAKQWAERGRRADSPGLSPAKVVALLDAGRVDEAFAAVQEYDRPAFGGSGSDEPDLAVQAQVLMARFEFEALRQRVDHLLRTLVIGPSGDVPTEGHRRALHLGLLAFDDAARVDSLTRAWLATPRGGTPEWLAAGRLAYDMLDYPRADSCFAAALASVASTKLDPAVARSAALAGQALVLQKRRDWDGSLARLTEALGQHTSPEALNALVETLVRLGRTDEAISAAQWAVRFHPYSDAAHYSLGNGYTRKNYTELRAAYPRAFADAAGRGQLRRADSLLGAGRRKDARAAYERLHRARSGWADVLVRLASLDFEDGRFREARERCFQALRICPEYGRAHAVLAKALESQRFEADVHRADYERRFAAAPMPKIEGIERFVINWASLSPRHQKRVALSIAPWKQFVPVLIEGGATNYVKPLHMLLSETPGQQTLKDQRINGIEDVERTIFDRYNTVLHELTHQVHAVLTANQSREIQELYRRAKARDEATRNAFLSRYAGGSVWEYFAEGANALESPKRDAYDPREVVRERLERTPISKRT